MFNKVIIMLIMRNLFFSLSLMIVLPACQQKLTLSCDPEINNWAQENIQYYVSSTRSEIVSLPLSRQRAIYRGLPGEVKVQLWKEKYEYVKKNNLLSEEELSLFSYLINSLNKEIFEDEEKRKMFNSFAEQWENIMREQFGWGDDKVFSIACCWMTEDEFAQAVVLDTMLHTRGESGDFNSSDKEDCDCRYDIYCQRMSFTECRKNIDCNESDGCGIVGTSSCTGKCQ